MSVQMIELEEVQMVETIDDALELSSCGKAAATMVPTSAWPC